MALAKLIPLRAKESNTGVLTVSNTTSLSFPALTNAAASSIVGAGVTSINAPLLTLTTTSTVNIAAASDHTYLAIAPEGTKTKLSEDTLVASGLVRRKLDGVRILAKGELKSKVNLVVTGASRAAIEAVSKAVKRARTGLNDPYKPLGGFLFLGPTGVGKTELTKALANYLFDDINAMVRLDMSEYMEKHSVARLVGAPPGYIGYDEGGTLTEKIRRRPYQVILFDEVEKAHPDVFNILLQVLDDGRLTDNHGNVVDFKNTIIILTSNLGSEKLINNVINKENRKVNVMGVVRDFFRPEFLNRLDEIIIFNNLPKEIMKEIVLLQIQELKERLLEKNIKLLVENSCLDWLADRGYDPTFGARPLKRLIQKEIQNNIAEGILSGKISEGSEISLLIENKKIKIINN